MLPLLIKRVEESRAGECWAGSLLVAHPNMLDPNFRRAVLYLSAHSAEEGASGIILNRPLDKQVSDLTTDPPPDGLENVAVFFGGPVGRDRLMFATLDWRSATELEINNSFDLTDVSRRREKDPGCVRAFVGYAGWSAGQLEAEMKQDAWVIQKPKRDTIKIERLPRLWFDIMGGLGPWFKMLAAAPDDPSLN